MSDDSSNLRTMVNGSTDRAVIADKVGTEHVLSPLDFSDLVEYEDKMGVTLLSLDRALKFKDIGYILYLSLRKEGLSPTQIEHRQFKYTEAQVLRMFDLKLLSKTNDFITDLLKISGLEIKADKKIEDPLVQSPV